MEREENMEENNNKKPNALELIALGLSTIALLVNLFK